MRVVPPAVCLAVLVLGAAAPMPSAEQAWKAGVADENKDYAQVPHAMLKIQDAAYLGEGQSAVLQGESRPARQLALDSAPPAQGAISVSLHKGKLAVTQERQGDRSRASSPKASRWTTPSILPASRPRSARASRAGAFLSTTSKIPRQ